MVMRQKHLEIALTSMNRKFESPRIELEQHLTHRPMLQVLRAKINYVKIKEENDNNK